jgi:hypothetical protein
MRKSPLLSSGALLGAALIVLAACAAPRPGTAGAPASPQEVLRGVLGANPGLSSVRAVAEAKISYAGRSVSLPGILQLDGLDGFRLELLDPLDRPVAIFYAEGGRIVQFRPGSQLGASLGVFPASCGGIDPADWVPAVIAAGSAPPAGENLLDRATWGSDRALERYRDGELRQSIRYRARQARLVPGTVSWYCGEEAVLLLRFREWVGGADWRLPTRFEVEYPNAGLLVRIELREIEANPPPTGAGLRPLPGSSTRWTTWDLPR